MSTTPHDITVGTSGTGKTSLVAALCRQWRRSGRYGVLVCDPKGDPRLAAAADRNVPDIASFYALAREARSCHLVIDEAGLAVGRYRPEFLWFTAATRGHPWCHITHLIAQSPMMLDPLLRRQVGAYNLFPAEREAFDMVAREMLTPDVEGWFGRLRCEPGRWCEFLRVEKFRPLRVLRLDIASGRVTSIKR